MKKYLTDIVYVSIFFLLVGVFFYPTLIQRKLPVPADSLVGLYHPWRDLYAKDYPRGIPFKNFLITDPVRQQIPWRKIISEQWKDNNLPIWNPYNFSGTPLAGNIQAAAFYPFNLLFLLFNFPVAWTLLIILEPLLSGLFFYFYLRSLRLDYLVSFFGAVVWSFSGFSIAWLTWGTIVHASMWLPLALLAIEKILSDKPTKVIWWLILLTASISFAFFAGHVQVAGYIFILSCIYALFKLSSRFIWRNLLFLGLSLAMIILVTTIQWLPLLRLILVSSRVEDLANWLKPGWFLPWQNLVQFIVPDFFGNPTTLNYWGIWNYGEFVGYLGIIPFVFAFLALARKKDNRTWFWLGVVFVVLAFMLPTPLAKLPYSLKIPILSSLQPTRLMVLLDFSLVVLACLGFSQWLERREKRDWWILVLAGCIVTALWLMVSFGRLVIVDKLLIANLEIAKRNLILPTLILAASAVIVFGFEKIRKTKVVRGGVVAAVLAITVFDLFRFGWKFTPFSDSQYFFPETPSIRFLETLPKPFRVMSLDKRILPPNSASFYGIESIEGYDPLILLRYEELAAASERARPDIRPPFGFNRIVTFNNLDSPLFSLFNARYVLSLTDLDKPYLKKVFQEGETRVYENLRSLARAFLTNQVITETNKDKIIKIMFDPAFDPGKVAVVEGSPEIRESPPADSEYVKIVDYRAASMVLSAQTQLPRFLVIVNSFNACWQATVDQMPSKLYRTDYLFLGLAVPSGSHTIVLTCQSL